MDIVRRRIPPRIVFEKLVYPDDSILRKMRGLKKQTTNVRTDWRQQRAPAPGREGTERFVPKYDGCPVSEADDLLDGIADGLESLDKVDLQNLRDPILAIIGDCERDLAGYSENSLREYLSGLAVRLHTSDRASLRAIHSVILAFLRQKLR